MDLNIRVGTTNIEGFIGIAHRLGIEYLIATGTRSTRDETDNKVTPRILPRVNLTGKTLNALRTQINQFRRKAVIVAVSLGEISLANWAADDSRIDLLTLNTNERRYRLKFTTAKLAASADVALEIPIRPLLMKSGFERSKILKVYRETTRIALSAGMQVVLSSGAHAPIEMRAPAAMRFIGTIVGLEQNISKDAEKWALERVCRNLSRLDDNFVAPGVKIIDYGRRKK